ncbi:hypothetical protein ACSBR1_011600 [Camellia fascicularis]
MFLEVLNLSDNQLAGPIPQGRQFYTFENDSYSGNLALCGIPLSKKCKELQALPPPPTFQQDENSDKSSGFSWQVVVMVSYPQVQYIELEPALSTQNWARGWTREGLDNSKHNLSNPLT